MNLTSRRQQPCDVSELFHLSQVSSSELLTVLLHFFKRGGWISESVQRFGTEDAFVEVLFTKDGKTEAVRSNLSKDQLETSSQHVEEILILNQQEKVGQALCFSSQFVVRGVYRYKNIFQMMPIPVEAATAPVIVADHPFILQFRYISCPDMSVNAMRRKETAAKLTRALNVVCRPYISSGPSYTRFFWSCFVSESSTAQWLQEGYGYRGFNPELTDFSDASEQANMKLHPSAEYYQERFHPPEHELVLPELINDYFDRVFTLTPADFAKFEIASTWFSQVHELWSTSRSSAFVAVVSAIEALLDKKSERCKECGQPKHRITKKFKGFLEKFVPNVRANFPEELARVYQVRSALAHGAKLMLADLEPWSFFGGVREQQEYWIQSNTHTIIATAIRNWVLHH